MLQKQTKKYKAVLTGKQLSNKIHPLQVHVSTKHLDVPDPMWQAFL